MSHDCHMNGLSICHMTVAWMVYNTKVNLHQLGPEQVSNRDFVEGDDGKWNITDIWLLIKRPKFLYRYKDPSLLNKDSTL